MVGYTNRFSVRVGEALEFKVSCRSSSYDAQFVRLRHGDLDPDGPGFRADPVLTDADGSYPGRHQRIQLGSYVVVDDPGTIAELDAFTLTSWVFPTTRGAEPCGLVAQWSGERAPGFRMLLDTEGCLELHVANGTHADVVRLNQALPLSAWSFVAASVDGRAGQARLAHYGACVGAAEPAWHSTEAEVHTSIARRGPVLIAASHLAGPSDAAGALGCFTGKVARPQVFGTALDPDTIAAVCVHGRAPQHQPVAAWDFAREIATDTIVDASGSALHGRAVNMPMRAVTGPGWTGREVDFRAAPDEYDAIHFHDDDLDDAGWATDFVLEVPAHWESGVYAAHLSSGGFNDYVPFFVRPPATGSANRIALLLPTATYMAYANEHMMGDYVNRLSPDYVAATDAVAAHGTPYEAAAFRYITDIGLNSVYDLHADFTGACYSSRLRPIVNMRPRYNKPGLKFRHAHGLNCDLYIVDWLTEKGYPFDVVTDEDLHHEGRAALSPYRVVLTGSHPEYWTWEMLTGLRGYLADGGRLMYLGGNGMYWVSSLSPHKPHVLEVRRGVSGTRAWSSSPGEVHHSSTGVMGGPWRDRGLPPQSTVGIGFSGIIDRFADEPGGVNAVPYVRTAASHDPRAMFIFEGVDTDVIGDFGLHFGAAAGYELDSADLALGTPAHALVVATADASAIYQPAIELLRSLGRDLTVAKATATRADMVFFEGPSGGAVFSVGSISWAGSLSHNGYENPVSRIMQNVLERFDSELPFVTSPS